MSDGHQPGSPEPAQPSVQDLLRDLRELTSRRFVYEDGWCGLVPADDTLSELQTGPPVAFADLHWRDQADVLRGFIPWDRYGGLGLAWDVEYTVSRNITAGKPPDQWLETSPPPGDGAPNAGDWPGRLLDALHVAVAPAEPGREPDRSPGGGHGR